MLGEVPYQLPNSIIFNVLLSLFVGAEEIAAFFTESRPVVFDFQVIGRVIEKHNAALVDVSPLYIFKFLCKHPHKVPQCLLDGVIGHMVDIILVEYKNESYLAGKFEQIVHRDEVGVLIGF